MIARAGNHASQPKVVAAIVSTNHRIRAHEELGCRSIDVSSQTTEGLPSRCPLCGKKVWTSPSQPAGDATCPHCGSLLWFDGTDLQVGDPIRRLVELGAEIESDDEGQVTSIRFVGSRYNDSVIDRLSELSAIPVIDIRDTGITEFGAKRLRELLPDVEIRHR